MSELNTENILGYAISTLNTKSCIKHVMSWLNSKHKKIFVCANPHSLVTAQTDPYFQEAINSADLVTPDGVGIVIASKLLGGNIRDRVTGSDIYTDLSIALNANGGHSYFFLGSTQETLDKIRAKITIDYPNITFAGSFSPPYKDVFSDEDNLAMIEAVNAAKPDVLWVGMTAPKQEKWILQNKDKLDVKFIGAIGAVFDFFVGNVKRSHPVFQKLGLEWLPRLIQQPRRLFRRNFISSPLFMLRVLEQRLKN